MWLTSFMAKNIKGQKSAMAARVTETDNSRVALSTCSKHREVPLIAPWGIVSLPPVGAKAVSVDTSKGQVCLGFEMPDTSELEEGEIMLFSKGGKASIVLKNDGRILMKGEVLSQ